MFEHCEESGIVVSRSRFASQQATSAVSRETYQGTISHKLSKTLVDSGFDLLLQHAKRHRLLNYVIVVRDIALVNTAVEESRGIMTATSSQQRLL
jgi:hypothetical protein